MKRYFRNPLNLKGRTAKKGINMNRVDTLLNSEQYDEAQDVLVKGLKHASTEKERARIATMLGVFHYYGLGSTPNHNYAKTYFEQAISANKGGFGQEHAEAFHYLGLMHAQGDAVNADVGKALEYYRQAAKYGYDESQYKLGMIYKSGKGVLKNENLAFKYFQKASYQNHSKAQNQLAMMYAAGSGVEKDDKQAVHWYTCAANQGNDIAQYNLGYMYCEGRGVEQSYTTANHWFMKVAQANGYDGDKKGNGDGSSRVHSLV